MSILIKGVPMPKDRQLCIGIDEGHIFYKHPSENEWHMSDDSLIELPPHGRLIDADALNLDYEVEMADDWKTAHEIANVVKYAPTIIDAERRE